MPAQPYDPRTIALLSELIHPPIELQASSVQAIHNELYGHAEFSYQNFSVGHDGISISNVGDQPGFVSMVNFLPDRIQIREELSGAHVDDFNRRLLEVTRISIERLSLPIVIAQQHVVRSLITPRHFPDSRDFLATGVCHMPLDGFAAFGRPVQLFGMKMIFPATEDSNVVHTLRIESFNQDPRCVFLEDVATFPTAIQPTQLGQLSENMAATYDFVREKALLFLSRYDRAEASE